MVSVHTFPLVISAHLGIHFDGAFDAVIPAKAGTHARTLSDPQDCSSVGLPAWVPAFAGMTNKSKMDPSLRWDDEYQPIADYRLPIPGATP